MSFITLMLGGSSFLLRGPPLLPNLGSTHENSPSLHFLSSNCRTLPADVRCYSTKQLASSQSNQRRIPPRLRTDVSPSRAYSVVRLLRIEEGGAYADILSGGANDSWEREMHYVERTLGFRTAPLDFRDQRQVTEIVAGITRWKKYLDFLLRSYYDATAYEKMEPLLRQILLLGVYELVKLGTPGHAAVNEAVKLGKVALRGGAGNLVNAILRKVSSNQKAGTLMMPEMDGNDRARARGLAILYSHPVWMVRRWVSRYGEDETISLMAWNNTPPTFFLRANHSRCISRERLLEECKQLEVSCEPSSFLPDFVRITMGMQAIIQAGLMKKGMCAVQDASAGLVVRVVDPQPGDIIVDCCAAPGGKALYMASCLENQGKVWAVDINEGRLHLLVEAAKNLGVETAVGTYYGDMRNFALQTDIRADKVLVDAPCSGLGVLSKRADLRWKKDMGDMEVLQSLQQDLLNAAARIVKPGGILVYSTCSIEPSENEQAVKFFLDQHPDFVLETVEPFVPQQFVSGNGFFQSLPHKHHMDGAFASRFRKQSA